MRPIWAVIAIVVVAVAGCGGAGKAPTDGLPRVYSGGPPATGQSPAFAFLRRDVPVALAASSPRALDRALGFANLSALIGGDRIGLTDLGSLARAGIDLARPVGLALIDLPSNTWAMFATVADRHALDAFADAVAARLGFTHTRTQAGSATILLPAGDAGHAVVQRGTQVFLIVSEGVRSVRDLAAVRIATTDRSDSLSDDLAFRHVATELRFGREIAGYAALDRVAIALVQAGEPAAEQLARAATAIESQLARAEKAGAKSDQLALLRQQGDWVIRLQRAHESRQRFLLEVVGALGTIAFGIEADGAAARVKLVATPDVSTLPGKLLAAPTSPPRLLAALSAQPLFALAVRAPSNEVSELVDLWLATRGASLTELAGRLDIDFESDVAPLLSGEIGIAVTTTESAAGRLSSPRAQTALQLIVGIRDRSRADDIFARLGAQTSPDTNARRGPSSSRITLPWPGFQPLQVGLMRDALVASTEAGFFERADRATGQASFVHRLADPALRELLANASAPAVAVVDGALLPGLFAAGPARPGPRIALADSRAAPATPEYAELVERIARLEAEIAALEREQAEAELERTWALGHRLGTLALLARPHRSGVVAYGGLFLPGDSVRQALAAAVRQSRKNDRQRAAAARALSEQQSRLNALEKERARIQSPALAPPP